MLAGTHPASEIYVRNKIATVGETRLPGRAVPTAGDGELDDALALVRRLERGRRASTPSWCSRRCRPGWAPDAEQRVFDAIDPAKDVDGFHPINVGLLVQKRPALVACTPLGCVELLDREQIPLAGRHAVVIGRSDIVGKPMALLLLHRDATVTICHSRTRDLPAVCRIG